MEEEMKNSENIEKDFDDFEEATATLPEIDEDLVEEETNEKASILSNDTEEEAKEPIDIFSAETNELAKASEETDFSEEHDSFHQDFQSDFEYETMQMEAFQASLQNEMQFNFDEATGEIASNWQQQEEEDEDAVVKKYILYISKDFVPYLDNLTTDQRSAYINDAIQIKLDLNNEEKQKEKRKKLLKHFMVMALTICFCSPIIILAVHKSIMATFDNYKYTQESFEKLYRQRFAKDKAYMRSIQYNREMQYKKTKTH